MMMAPPQWMNEVIAEFGRSAGIDGFSFGDRATAALSFGSGAMLVFEYAYSSLVVMMTVPVAADSKVAEKALGFVMPERRGEFRVKAGFLADKGRVFFAVRLPHDEVSLPVVNSAFSHLRRLADQFGEGAV
jgi:type III secretion system chaperone SycN